MLPPKRSPDKTGDWRPNCEAPGAPGAPPRHGTGRVRLLHWRSPGRRARPPRRRGKAKERVRAGAGRTTLGVPLCQLGQRVALCPTEVTDDRPRMEFTSAKAPLVTEHPLATRRTPLRGHTSSHDDGWHCVFLETYLWLCIMHKLCPSASHRLNLTCYILRLCFAKVKALIRPVWLYTTAWVMYLVPRFTVTPLKPSLMPLTSLVGLTMEGRTHKEYRNFLEYCVPVRWSPSS